MNTRKKRRDAGIKRVLDKTEDKTFTFKVNPDDPIEGPVYQRLESEKNAGNLRKFIVQCVAGHVPSPMSREAALDDLHAQAKEHFDNLSDELNRAIDRLLSLQLTAVSTGKESQDAPESTTGVNLDFLKNIQATLKKKR